MTRIDIPLGDRSYAVSIGRVSVAEVVETLAQTLGTVSGVAVVADEHVLALSSRGRELAAALAARLPRVATWALPRGEACKTLAQVERTAQWLAEQGFDRGAAVIGLGGGAATDHAGFVAAVYQRGIRFALCPTTLLAMVDASVGGKTAVDLPAGKNLVGAFHQPVAVVADLTWLDTLPARETAAGLAEVVKAGFIADAALVERLEELAAASAPAGWGVNAFEDIVARAVRIKAEVVAGDEREAGRRAILNFGHTLGHAIETASGYDLLHGEAVALGMVAALGLGQARGVTPAELPPRAQALLDRLGLPTDVGRHLSRTVLDRIEVDKKRRADAVRFVFVPRAGAAELHDLPLAEVKAAAARLWSV